MSKRFAIEALTEAIVRIEADLSVDKAEIDRLNQCIVFVQERINLRKARLSELGFAIVILEERETPVPLAKQDQIWR